MKKSGYSDLIKKSPLKPIQDHMEISQLSVAELLIFLDHAVNSRWEDATSSRKNISDLENKADKLKAETRGLLTKGIFLAVQRSDLLDLIKLADEIPNTAKDISGLMLGRRMDIPSTISNSFINFAKEASQISSVAGDAVGHLEELFRFSFGGNVADRMQELILELDNLEKTNDQTEINLRAELFKLEADLPPIDVMFLYDIINKIGELSDRSQQVGHRISLIASR